MGILGIIIECLSYVGWVILESAGLIINPFTFILELFSLGASPSVPNALQIILNLLGGRFTIFVPVLEVIEAGLYSYMIYEFVDSMYKLGDRFKKWLGFK